MIKDGYQMVVSDAVAVTETAEGSDRWTTILVLLDVLLLYIYWGLL
jgi:hypothetical protein